MANRSGDVDPGEITLVGPAPGQRPPEPMSTQRKARKQALDILFEADLRRLDAGEHLARRVADAEAPPVRDLGHRLVTEYVEHAREIDQMITGQLAPGWSLQRMPRVDRCLARLAVAELQYVGSDPGIAISEAMALAEIYSTDDSRAFLNGVLGRIARDHTES